MFKRHVVLIHRMIFTFLLMIAFGIAPSYAQDSEINRLQQKINELEQKIKKLETLLNESILIPKNDSQGWYNKKNWRKLEVGMTQNQVSEILGEPIKIIQGQKILWYYPNIYGGIVIFNDNGCLVSWNEP
jgi:hypothetical protein